MSPKVSLPVAPRPQRDRGGRGRRGRGGPGGQGQGNRRGPSRRSAQTSDLPIISDLLKPGQEILVQIAKEPIAKKGARITSHIALPGRFLVFMPTVTHVGVSRKIASDEERQRLKRILTSERGEASGGFIVRTAAEGASEEELRADLRFLIHLWDEIKQRSESSKSPALIYHDLSLIERILRDQVSANFSSIWVDSQDDYERIVRFLNRFSPTLVRRVKLYTKETPLFEHFGIQDEISKALRSKVWLKCGGSIVINQTEALVAIDINTGKYVGKSARLEDTIVKTNLDAVPEIVRQIRLRDLGGIIIIDFIDMDERKNRFKVMAALEEALKSDRAPTKVLQFNDFGLVAITRKRVKQSLERTLSVPCPTCQATGMVKSPTTVCNEILHRVAQDAEALRKRRCAAAREPRNGEGAQVKQRALAHRIRRAGRQEHPGQERRHPASGAVRHPGLSRNISINSNGRSRCSGHCSLALDPSTGLPFDVQPANRQGRKGLILSASETSMYRCPFDTQTWNAVILLRFCHFYTQLPVLYRCLSVSRSPRKFSRGFCLATCTTNNPKHEVTSMSSFCRVSLMRHVSILTVVAAFAAAFASAQFAPSPNPSASVSAFQPNRVRARLTCPIPVPTEAALPSAPARLSRRMRARMAATTRMAAISRTAASAISRLRRAAAPTAPPADSSSYITWGGNLTLGAGYRINP